MSLRTRLLVFFLGIVIVPMLVVAGVVLSLVDRAERGERRARLAVAEQAAISLFEDHQNRAATAAEIIGGSPELAEALRAGRRGEIRSRLEELATRSGAARARLTLPGRQTIDVGVPQVVAPASARLQGAERGVALTVSVLRAQDYAALLARTTGRRVGLWSGGRTLATMGGELPPTPPPLDDGVELGGEQFEVAGFDGPAFGGGRLRRACSTRAPRPSGAGRP